MKARRLFLCCSFFLVASAPAHAHGDGLLMLVAFAMAPFLILIFLPICVLPGMDRRRWMAFGLYLAAIIAAFALQWQHWYEPFARLFPEPAWLQERLPKFVLVPPLDILMWLVLAVTAIYLALRDRSVPFRVVLPPAGNLLWGSLFSMAAVLLWTYVLFDPVANSWIRSWPEGVKMPLFMVWVFILPVVFAFIAIHLFRNGLRFSRNRARR